MALRRGRLLVYSGSPPGPVIPLRNTLFLLLLWGCGGPEPAADASAEIREDVAPRQGDRAAEGPAPAGQPLMRAPIHCCSDSALQAGLTAYLEMGTLLVHEQTEGIAALRDEMVKQLGAVTPSPQTKAAIEAAAGMDGCALEACRVSYGAISDPLMILIDGSRAGELDVAIAWARAAEHHWIQDGPVLQSPYGDAQEFIDWGTQAQVVKADAARATSRGEGNSKTPVPPPPDTPPDTPPGERGK